MTHLCACGRQMRAVASPSRLGAVTPINLYCPVCDGPLLIARAIGVERSSAPFGPSSEGARLTLPPLAAPASLAAEPYRGRRSRRIFRASALLSRFPSFFSAVMGSRALPDSSRSISASGHILQSHSAERSP